jgi:flavorubredoxin
MAHWPESMVTFDLSSKILFSMDAFGQHYASNYRFDDNQERAPLEHIMKEAKIYYANILYGLAKPVSIIFCGTALHCRKMMNYHLSY